MVIKKSIVEKKIELKFWMQDWVEAGERNKNYVKECWMWSSLLIILYCVYKPIDIKKHTHISRNEKM